MRLTQKQYETLKNRIERANSELKCDKQVRPLGEKKTETKDFRRDVVRIKSFRTRLLDRDNLWGGVKIHVDCLKELNLIKDDSEFQIDLIVTQEKVFSKKEERVEIEIFKAETT